MHPRVLKELADIYVKPLSHDILKVMAVMQSPWWLEKGKYCMHT